MGTLIDGEKNALLAATTITHLSLHTADPGATGTSEVAGGSPAYARKAVTWNVAANGERTLAADVEFDVPAGVTVAWVGGFDALTGGNFRGKENVTDEVFANQGKYKVLASGSKLDLND